MSLKRKKSSGLVTRELKEKKKEGDRAPSVRYPKVVALFDMICDIYTGTTYYEYGKIAY